MVGELIEVALDVTGCECAASSGEDGVHVIPGQQGAVITISKIVGKFALGEHAGCG